jgi:CheY-like chemotaxis protein
MTSPFRVLIADDQPSIVIPLQYLVEQVPRVMATVVHDGQAAVAEALAHRPDLIILDVHMPGLDGYAACRQILADWSGDPPLIWFLTARGSHLDADQARTLGAQRLITKPFDPDQLLVLIRQAAHPEADIETASAGGR